MQNILKLQTNQQRLYFKNPIQCCAKLQDELGSR